MKKMPALKTIVIDENEANSLCEMLNDLRNHLHALDTVGHIKRITHIDAAIATLRKRVDQ